MEDKGKPTGRVAAQFHIPHTTLQDRRKGRYALQPHPNRALMPDEEEALLRYIFWMAAHAFPITKSVALVLAIQICKASGRPNPFVNMEKGLSKMWWSRFRARRPTVASRRANPLERERLHGATVERVDELFHICQALYDQHELSGTPELIYNCDETGFGDKGHSKQRILCHKGQRCVYAQQVTTREHITVHCCANAAGESIPPFVIFRGSFPSTAYGLEGPQNALYGVSEKGYMDSDLFLKWLGHFVMIEVVCLPAHTTHVLQPLDVAVYGSLKAAFSRLARNMGLVRGDLVIGKWQFSAVLKYALEEACTPHNIIMKPRVRLLQRILPGSGAAKVTYLATGFYPCHINLTLLRDGQPVSDHQITGGELLPNGDETYQMRKSLEVSAEELQHHHYTCTAEHLSLDNKLDTDLDKGSQIRVDKGSQSTVSSSYSAAPSSDDSEKMEVTREDTAMSPHH
ncbi:hypothetical protein AALO_G00074160 [Alosa alosa]|uniref:HTH CENPB-type domain-containing protein n=1 Tax=Alosa alosa TaxID=278164 RepID=A0AAV6H2R9_9TELE|nr:hypothetical protein AALO_G00074160 [Alosa alosa]